MVSRLSTGLIACVLVLFTWVPAAMAHGQVAISVVDSAGRPLNGRVTASGPQTRTCTTTASRCTLRLRAGTYRLTLAPRTGSAPAPRTIRVTATGSMRITLRAGPARPRNASGATLRGSGIRAATSGTSTSMSTTMSTTRPRVSGSAVRARSGITSRATTSGTRVSTGVNTAVRRPTGSTSGSSSTMVNAPAVRATGSGTVRASQTGTPSYRNLGRGSRLVAQGEILDAAGRPTNGTVLIKQGTRVIGQCTTAAGRFSVFDLPHGSYQVEVRRRNSRTVSGSGALTIGSRVPRVTYRVR